MQVSKRVIFTGNVQGVGFRYTAHGLARIYSVRGHVRNLPDGAVELVAAGPREDVQGFIDAVCERMSAYISARSESDCAGPVEEGFDIRF